MTLILCTMPQCQSTAGCICGRELKPTRTIHLQMCRMAAAFVRMAGEQEEPAQPNAMVCAEQPCRYPDCKIGAGA